MSKVPLLLLLTLPLFAGSVINQHIYEKENSVDVMLSFDSPYEGKIIQKKDKENSVLILEDMTTEKENSQDIHSPILQKLQLIPYKNQLFIKLSGLDDFQVDASKTVDNYGLRLRVTPLDALREIAPIKEVPYETKKEDDIGAAYLKVLLVLAGLVALLYFLKKWLLNRTNSVQGSWLFDKNTKQDKNSIKVLQQRALDIKNRLALVSYGDKEYLLLLGNSNLLIDTFETSNLTHESDFDKELSENEERLSSFIKSQSKRFDAYKKKSSNIP